MTIQNGQQAPDFTLFNTDKQEVTLSNLKGKKVVLLFVPAAFTGTCTKELCSIRDGIAAYNNVNAEVMGISCDSVFVLGKWKEQEGFNFTMLSDYNKQISALYGVDYPAGKFPAGMYGHSKRSAFVLDENGVVKYAEVLDVASDLPNFEAIMAALN
jgi:glutaredoxin-dependent peroxiredoxin